MKIAVEREVEATVETVQEKLRQILTRYISRVDKFPPGSWVTWAEGQVVNPTPIKDCPALVLGAVRGPDGNPQFQIIYLQEDGELAAAFAAPSQLVEFK